MIFWNSRAGYIFCAALIVLCGCDPSNTSTPISLRIAERQIVVNGRSATVYCLVQPDGTYGLTLKKDTNFDVLLDNQLKVPTSIHWHGLILPNKDDGVAFVTQYAIYPGGSYRYQFPLVQTGTFWMHSHVGLQEQNQLSAPLILQGPEDREIADQDVVLFLTDFSFKTPEEIYTKLRCQRQKMDMRRPDLVEVDYDAFLTNARTLDDPEVDEVKPGSRIRLRIINGSSATNFLLSFGALQPVAIAIDGNRIEPLKSTRFELAVAQRIDILVTIPEAGGAFPILAQGEGTDKQTGLVLATKGSPLPTLSGRNSVTSGALTNANESLFRPVSPLLTKPVDQKINIDLGGDMATYIWTLNSQAWPNATPIIVEKDSRVEITFKNLSTMAHPMHLHGHVFQVTALDDLPIQGAMRDTVLVLPSSSVTVQFDADNPGVWPLHCHVLYHLEAGMMTVVRYKDYIQSL